MIEKFHGKKIVVLMGGLSREREISLKSGNAILASLRRQGYEVSAIEADDRVAESLQKEQPFAAIVALHGRYGEDGSVQGMLEIMQIPYSGSGVLASAICMDKALTKRLVAELGISVPKSCAISETENVSAMCRESGLACPLVVKPNSEGSTLGIMIVREADQLKRAVQDALSYDDTVLIEDYIMGTEVTVGLVNDKPLPVLEVVPTSGFYDYEAKYSQGLTEYIVPARIPNAVAQRIQDESMRMASYLEIEGISRVDYIVDADNEPYFLEINTIPGMTETSLVPKAAAAAGLSFDELAEAMLASCRLKIGRA